MNRYLADIAALAALFMVLSPLLSGTALAQAPGSRAAAIRACEAGDMYQCGNAGLQMLQGTDGPKDAAGARRYYERSCTGEVAISCFSLGMGLSLSYFGGPANPAAALPFYARGCQLGLAQSCTDEGTTARGLGDMTRARTATIKGCQSGDPGGCNNAGHLIGRGIGGPANYTLAASYFDAACKMNHQGACQTLMDARRAGGIPAALPAIRIARTTPNEGRKPAAPAAPSNADRLAANSAQFRADVEAWKLLVDQNTHYAHIATSSTDLVLRVTAKREKCVWLRDAITNQTEALRYAEAALRFATSHPIGADLVAHSREMVASQTEQLNSTNRSLARMC